MTPETRLEEKAKRHNRATIVALIIFAGLGLTMAAIQNTDIKFTTSMLWALGSLAIGYIFGFLFGIPKELSWPISSTKPRKDVANRPDKEIYNRDNAPNLVQIADWLTKILLGAGLVELTQLPSGLRQLSRYIATAAKEEVFISAVLLYFSCLGFISGVLTTRLIIIPAFKKADSDTGLDESQFMALKNVPVPSPGDETNLTGKAAEAADKLIGKALGSLENVDDIGLWAKAKLKNGEYESAIKGYLKALRISPFNVKFLVEYAIALSFGGNRTKEAAEEAVKTLERACHVLKASTDVDPSLRNNVYAWLTYYLLYLPKPVGYEKVIDFGTEYLSETRQDLNTSVLINIACAYGQLAADIVEAKRDTYQTDPEYLSAKERVLDLSKKAINQEPRAKASLRKQWDRNNKSKSDDDNDLEVFFDDLEFKALFE